MLIAGPLLKYV